jgi:hypothetical protein
LEFFPHLLHGRLVELRSITVLGATAASSTATPAASSTAASASSTATIPTVPAIPTIPAVAPAKSGKIGVNFLHDGVKGVTVKLLKLSLLLTLAATELGEHFHLLFRHV